MPSFGISIKIFNPNFSAASLSSTVIVVASMEPAWSAANRTGDWPDLAERHIFIGIDRSAF